MKISFIGSSLASLNLALYLNDKSSTISGIYDVSLQKAVEFAMKSDTKALLSLNELIEESELIFISDTPDLKSIISNKSLIRSSNKLLCLISDKNSSEAIFTNEENTHFSMYCPELFSTTQCMNDNSTVVFEGYGIRRTDMTKFLDNMEINHIETSIDKISKLHCMISILTNGIKTLNDISDSICKELDIQDTEFINTIVKNSATDTDNTPSFYNNDTYHIIKTMDTLKDINSASLLSLFKIIGLNALEYASYTKSERDHITQILLENHPKR